MASIKVVLKSSQPRRNGTIAILLRITAGRRSKYISTGYYVKASQFKEGSENWVSRHPDAVLINNAIESKRAALAKTVYLADAEGSKLTIDDIGHKRGRGTFYTAIKVRMNVLEQNNQVAMYNRLRAKINILRLAWGKDLLICDINNHIVEKYIHYRISKNIKISSIKKDLSDFSNVLNNSSYEGKDWFKLAQKKLKADPVNREKLTLEEIKSIESVTLYGLNDIARDMFLFSFYCHGMRFQNVAMMEPKMISGGVLRYRMNKGKKIREIEVHSKLQGIINKYHSSPYLFPVVKELITDNWKKKLLVDSANALINLRLKRVAVIAGIEKNLSFHLSRHAFAYLTLERGVPMEIIKDALGHSSFNVTQQYLKSLSDTRINEAVKGLYD